MTIDITQHLPQDTAPSWAYDRAWSMACQLYPHRDNPAVMDALLVLLAFIRNHEDGTATCNAFGDAMTVYYTAQEAA